MVSEASPVDARFVAGIDEVGRGCLAGAVVAAAVILNPERPLAGLADSKALTPLRRQRLAAEIRERALAWAVGRAEASEVDRLNILRASLLAMRRAFFALSMRPDWVEVDGAHYPEIPCPGRTVVRGDQCRPAISAASVLAKVARDQEMQVLDALCPGYGFSRHKGYPTPAHLLNLQRLGVTRFHRRSFAPVREFLNVGSG